MNDKDGLLAEIADLLDGSESGKLTLRWWTSGGRRYVEVSRVETWKSDLPPSPRRSARQAKEVRQVLDLIRDRGYDAVNLKVVRQELGFKKTTAYHRLTEARRLARGGA